MNSMNKFWLIAISFLIYQFSFSSVAAQTIPSPDGKINMVMELTADGQPQYRVLYEGQEVVKRSPLGLVTNMGDFSSGLVLKDVVQTEISEPYELRNIKKSNVNYEATEAVFIYALKDKPETTVMEITFRVSNLDVAFRYKLYPKRDTRVCVVEKEVSGFVLPEGTTTFLCPQSKPMGGFARTSPSYETPYTLDDAMGKNGWGEGYTFPCLFKACADNWVLISETGTDGGYVGCRLLWEEASAPSPIGDGGGRGLYRIGFPQPGELNGIGSVTPAMSLPGETPWRTITVGRLANIVETTVAFDVVDYRHGSQL